MSKINCVNMDKAVIVNTSHGIRYFPASIKREEVLKQCSGESIRLKSGESVYFDELLAGEYFTVDSTKRLPSTSVEELFRPSSTFDQVHVFPILRPMLASLQELPVRNMTQLLVEGTSRPAVMLEASFEEFQYTREELGRTREERDNFREKLTQACERIEYLENQNDEIRDYLKKHDEQFAEMSAEIHSLKTDKKQHSLWKEHVLHTVDDNLHTAYPCEDFDCYICPTPSDRRLSKQCSECQQSLCFQCYISLEVTPERKVVCPHCRKAF
jgi:hypothetical protein